MTSLEEQALARNDLYLREFVEAYDLCPFARPCRESGALERRVISEPSLDAESVLRIIDELTTAPFDHIEVGLLIFPETRGSSAEFDRFAALLRRQHQGAANGFFIVAFHPDAPEDGGSPERIVPFLRRSPDPTLQLVRASVLERARGPRSGDTIWMDPAKLGESLPTVSPSVSDRIARRDFETVHRVGLKRLRALLDELRRSR